MSLVLPGIEVCRRARQSRDPRFDGRFFVAVLTTGIYCRPTCPARMPAESNVRYYATAAGAQDAGYRPCLRCRPEGARRTPEWTLRSGTVLRALRMIEAGFLNEGTCAGLASEMGVSERHLGRLFQEELGATPKRVAQLNRVRLARKLLVQTQMKLTDIAEHAGYGSVSRFNSELRGVYGMAPGKLRKAARGTGQDIVTLHLPVRQPYDFDWVFEFLRMRALDGIEAVSGGPGDWCYARRLGDAAQPVWLQVRQVSDGLQVALPLVDEPLHSLLRRVRRVFDLDADGCTLQESLRDDAVIGQTVRAAPGLRVPGAWDGFELAVRAILGQQVSVARATELANRMIEAYGEGDFPSPAQLASQDVAELGMPGQRGRAIAELARRVDAGDIAMDECQDFAANQARLEEIPGIGPWTANYIRMRALKDPDAFPDNDWVVMQQLDCTASAARKMSTAWQPWRAYALMYLWYAAGQRRKAAAAEKSAR